MPIIISDIHENTPAFRSAAFNNGDIILTVNFVDMTDMTHDDAVALLHNLVNTLNILHDFSRVY